MRRKDQKKYSKDFVYFLHLSLDMIDYFQFSFIYSTTSFKKNYNSFKHFFTDSQTLCEFSFSVNLVLTISIIMNYSMWANNQFLKYHDIVKKISRKIPLTSHPGSSYLTLVALYLRWE